LNTPSASRARRHWRSSFSASAIRHLALKRAGRDLDLGGINEIVAKSGHIVVRGVNHVPTPLLAYLAPVPID
jgi:hypothetical protein